MGKTNRDKAAEKALKAKIQKTHIKTFRILGSEETSDGAIVYVLRIKDNDNYLFKVNAVKGTDGAYQFSGFIPVTDLADCSEYRMYNPKPADKDALRPTEAERRKFKGYSA